MEYLMTYGWALLVIVIVIAVLIYINPFKAPEQCVFDQAGFLCQKPILFASGTLHATLVNGNQKNVFIMGMACIKGRTAPNGDFTQWPDYTDVGKTLAYQTQIDDLGNFQNDTGTAMSVKCVDVTAGTNGIATFPATPAIVLHAGDQFSGRIYIAYKYSDDPSTTVAKIVGANLVTQAQ